jgi:hypothetical protein
VGSHTAEDTPVSGSIVSVSLDTHVLGSTNSRIIARHPEWISRVKTAL